MDGRIAYMSKRINIRPTTSVYSTYKNIKYYPWTAIAEFVDNSTQNYYDHETKLKSTKYWDGLNIEIIYDRDAEQGSRIVIEDNAYGMDFHDFQRAIVLDSPPRKKNRSEFGMGLKTAACWFGMNWSVESTELGSSVKYKAIIDVDALSKYKNEEIEVEEIPCNPKEHGTTITIWNLNRTISGRQIGKTKDQLSGIYRVDLRTNDIHIFYSNGTIRTKLSYEEPSLLTERLPDGSAKVWKEPVDFDVCHEAEKYHVTGFIALRDPGSTANAGFALIKHGRVIIGGYENHYRPEEVFEKSNSFVYQRLFGELNLDEWPVTQTKDGFAWYNGLEDSFNDKLVEVCAVYCKKAKEYRKPTAKPVEPEFTKAANAFTAAGIIDHIEVSDLPFEEESEIDTDSPNSEGDNKPDIEIGINDKWGTDFSPSTSEEALNNRKGKQISFESAGDKYTYNFIMHNDEPRKRWLDISRRGKDNVYDIEWNAKHPFFRSYLEDQNSMDMMELFIFSFALAEIDSIKTGEDGKIDPSAIRLKMNEILKKVKYQEG